MLKLSDAAMTAIKLRAQALSTEVAELKVANPYTQGGVHRLAARAIELGQLRQTIEDQEQMR